MKTNRLRSKATHIPQMSRETATELPPPAAGALRGRSDSQPEASAARSLTPVALPAQRHARGLRADPRAGDDPPGACDSARSLRPRSPGQTRNRTGTARNSLRSEAQATTRCFFGGSAELAKANRPISVTPQKGRFGSGPPAPPRRDLQQAHRGGAQSRVIPARRAQIQLGSPELHRIPT